MCEPVQLVANDTVQNLHLQVILYAEYQIAMQT